MMGWLWRCEEMRVKHRQLRGLPGDSQLHDWPLLHLMRSGLLLVGCVMSGGGESWDEHQLHLWAFERLDLMNIVNEWRPPLMPLLSPSDINISQQIQHPFLHPCSHSCVYVNPLQHTQTHGYSVSGAGFICLFVCQWMKWDKKKKRARREKVFSSLQIKGEEQPMNNNEVIIML